MQNTSTIVHPEPDPVLAALDRNVQAAIDARSAYVLERERMVNKLQTAAELAQVAKRRSTFTVEEVAERLAAKPATVRDGAGKFKCLRKAAYKPGVRLLFPLQAIEVHEKNLMARGECGDCFLQIPSLKVTNRRE
jgi:hypothetical protein